jgi:acyl-CoA thioester hydrolase
MTHKFPIRVYYEDTDLAGIVYYANYLKFIERARSEWVREMGIDQVEMKAEGFVFAVRRVEADYLAPALYDDQLTVETDLVENSGVRLIVRQEVKRADVTLFAANVTIICMNASGAVARLPAAIRRSVHEIGPLVADVMRDWLDFPATMRYCLGQLEPKMGLEAEQALWKQHKNSQCGRCSHAPRLPSKSS